MIILIIIIIFIAYLALTFFLSHLSLCLGPSCLSSSILMFALLLLDEATEHSDFIVLVCLEVKAELFPETELEQVVVQRFF